MGQGHYQQVSKGGMRMEGDTKDRHRVALLISRGGCGTLCPLPSLLPFGGKRGRLWSFSWLFAATDPRQWSSHKTSGAVVLGKSAGTCQHLQLSLGLSASLHERGCWSCPRPSSAGDIHSHLPPAYVQALLATLAAPCRSTPAGAPHTSELTPSSGGTGSAAAQMALADIVGY